MTDPLGANQPSAMVKNRTMASNRSSRYASQGRASPVRLRLMLSGWLFLGVSTLVGMGGVKTQVPLMLVLFGAMMGSLLVSAMLARRMVTAVQVRRQVPTRAWQNQTVHLGYYLRNRRRGACLGLSLEEVAPKGIEGVAGYCVLLRTREIFRAGSRFAPRQRGRIRLSGVCVRTSFPFGLIQASRHISRAGALVVWPARGRLKRRLLRRGAVETSLGAPSPVSGGQDEFFGLREYRPGDNPRWIHWRRSATRTSPVIREMARPLPDVLWVILDTYWQDLSPVGEQNRERAIRFAATLVDHAFAGSYQVGLAFAGSDGVHLFRPAAGRGHRCTLLDALADVRDPITLTIDQLIPQVPLASIRNAQVMLISPILEQIDSNPLTQLTGACRHLRILGANKLHAVFEDNPLAREENG